MNKTLNTHETPLHSDQNYQPSQTIIIPEDRDGQRLDNFLIGQFKSLSKSHLYKLIRSGQVRVNSKRYQAKSKLQTGDKLRIPPLFLVPEARDKNINPLFVEQIKQRIIWEDECLLVFNKPAGWSVQGGSGVSLSLWDVVSSFLPDAHLVHRLDKETTGCWIVAKNRKVKKSLMRQFAERSVQKTYLLIVEGQWREAQRHVDFPLVINKLEGNQRKTLVADGGVEAITDFERVKSVSNGTLLKAYPHTGRTHQIRVHAAHCGHPVIGDKRYGGKFRNYADLLLHAQSIEFIHPESKHKITVETKPPESFKQWQKLELK